MPINFRQHSVTLDDDNSAEVRQLAKEQEVNDVPVDPDVDRSGLEGLQRNSTQKYIKKCKKKADREEQSNQSA